MRELSYDEFHSTFVEPMLNVTTSAEELVDLWTYAETAMKSTFPDVDSDDWNVEYVYESGGGAWQHVLIPSDRKNIYLVIVIRTDTKEIFGHHCLNLVELYGLEDAT